MEDIKIFKAGKTVIEEGAKANYAFVILSGTARVVKKVSNGEITLATLGRGQVFGEMGLIEDRPRSATVRAESDLKTRLIGREQFNELLAKDPSAIIPIMKNLFERLRQASEMLARRSEDIYSGSAEEKRFEIFMEGQTVEAAKALGERKVHIDRFPFLIGRRTSNDPDSDVFQNNDLFIEEEKPYVVSRNHLSINNERGVPWVVDRGSAFGVIVNGKDIGGPEKETRAPLNEKENQIVIGPATSKFIFLLKVNPL